MSKNKIRLLLAVIGLLIFLHYFKVLKPFENFLGQGLFNTQNFLFNQSNDLNIFFYYLLNAKKIYFENEQLKKSLSQQQLDKTAWLISQNENDQLKKALNYLKNTDYKYQTAKIIGQSTLNPQIFIIDQGKDSGILENNIVVYDDGIVLGKIDKVMDNTAYFLLMTDNQSQIAAKILNQDKTIGLVTGQLGINATLKMIPQEAEVMPGDNLVTSGLEQGIPSGLLLGKVVELKTSAQSLFKEAVIQPFFDIRQINYVQIIKN